MTSPKALHRLSIIIPARDEEDCIVATIRTLNDELRRHQILHEILVIDDGSSDATWNLLQNTRKDIAELRPLQNTGQKGIGRAICLGFDNTEGDAVVIMMAD